MRTSQVLRVHRITDDDNGDNTHNDDGRQRTDDGHASAATGTGDEQAAASRPQEGPTASRERRATETHRASRASAQATTRHRAQPDRIKPFRAQPQLSAKTGRM